MEDSILAIMESAARGAGAILRRHFETPDRVRAKGVRDLVSAADLESEAYLLRCIEAAHPEHDVWAEESGYHKREPGDNGPLHCWYVDPLDGTSNFIAGIPYFSISLALAREGTVVAATVHNPLLDEFYVAARGQGAWRNGVPIRVGTRTDPADCIGGCAFACDDAGAREGLTVMKQLTLSLRKTLVHFSPALDLCNVARGRTDIYVDNGTTPEDHAAASLIVQEAGGCVRNFATPAWDPRAPGIIASNPALQRPLLALLAGAAARDTEKA